MERHFWSHRFWESNIQRHAYSNLCENKKMEVIIEGIQSSMNIYVTAIFIDEKGTIKGGPVYSKFNLTMSKGMYVVYV